MNFSKFCENVMGQEETIQFGGKERHRELDLPDIKTSYNGSTGIDRSMEQKKVYKIYMSLHEAVI